MCSGTYAKIYIKVENSTARQWYRVLVPPKKKTVLLEHRLFYFKKGYELFLITVAARTAAA
jgi:hypothetical protein